MAQQIQVGDPNLRLPFIPEENGLEASWRLTKYSDLKGIYILEVKLLINAQLIDFVFLFYSQDEGVKVTSMKIKQTNFNNH